MKQEINLHQHGSRKTHNFPLETKGQEMPYVDDLIDSNQKHKEMFNADVSIECVSKEVASQMFPGVTLSDSNNVFYMPFKLCHSLPTVNARGRAFAPGVLKKSFASLNDQLIDWDHELENHGASSDKIIGHIKATRFDIPAEISDIASNPKRIFEQASAFSPLPVLALGVLFRRASGVEKAIQNHVNNKEKWATSMECGHLWSEAQFLYRGEFIPIKDADIAMRDCVKKSSVNKYKGHDLTVCLGGLDGEVDFWGAALTKYPADNTADILGIFAGANQELASRKIFYMPLQSETLKASEAASVSELADRKLEEIASIAVIGETEEADGHKHYILSDLTVVPEKGHTHWLDKYSINRGTKPKLTGHTEAHTVYSENGPQKGVHMHLVSLDLSGKFKLENSDDGDELKNVINKNSEEGSMNETLRKLLEKLNAEIANVSLLIGGDNKEKVTSLLSTGKEIASILSEKTTEAEIKNYIEGQIKDGKILTREQADAEIKKAKEEVSKELEEKAAAEKAEAEKRQSRVDHCKSLGIDLDSAVIKIGDSEIKIKDRFDKIPLDEDGDNIFNIDSAIWAKAIVEVEAEAANTGTKKPAKKQVVTIPTGTVSSGKEKASIDDEDDEDIPSHLSGRKGLSFLD